MKSTVVHEDGSVRCPMCGASVLGAASKRTGKAKWAAVATIGVGVAAMPKRIKCSGCGENLKRGGDAAPATPAVRKPTSAEKLAKSRADLAEARARGQELKAERAAKKQAKVDAKEAAKVQAAVPPPPPGMRYDEQAQRWARWDAESGEWVWA